MANDGRKNLIPQNERTKERQREIARMGGKASGKKRQEKKLLKDCLEILLEKKYKDENGKKKTGAEAISVKLFKEALKGNVKAFEVLRDTVGQKPVDKIMMAEIDKETIDEVEKMVKNAVDAEADD